MFGLAARLIGGMFTPLIDQATASSARLLRKLALFFAAGVALLVVVIALTVAFDLWIASMKGPIAGALAVAGLYFVAALIAIALALRPPAKSQLAAAQDEKVDSAAGRGRDKTEIDEFAAPLLKILQGLGLRREQLAVLAGTSIAKQIGPIPLVGLAIVAGFLLGRLGGGVKGLFSSDLFAALMASDLLTGLFGGTVKTPPETVPEDERRDAA